MEGQAGEKRRAPLLSAGKQVSYSLRNNIRRVKETEQGAQVFLGIDL